MPLRHTALYWHGDYALYDLGRGHPFRGERFEAFRRGLGAAGYLDLAGFELREPPRATDEDLRTVHDPRYLARLEQLARMGGQVSIDTPVNLGMLEAGRRIFGAALAAADSVVSDPGTVCVTLGGLHHAGEASGEGFCVYNDVAGSVRRLLDHHGLSRVMVIDTDAHHGNGTMDILYEEPRTVFLSIHQSPETLYPGRGWTREVGRGPGEGHIVNLPMPPGATRAHYERVWAEVVVPVAMQWQPEVVVQNGGCDPLWDDPLTDLGLELEDLEWLGSSFAGLADRVGAPLISMFLSGYSSRIVQGWLALLRGIVEPDDPATLKGYKVGRPVRHEPSRQADEYIDHIICQLREHHAGRWEL